MTDISHILAHRLHSKVAVSDSGFEEKKIHGESEARVGCVDQNKSAVIFDALLNPLLIDKFVQAMEPTNVSWYRFHSGKHGILYNTESIQLAPYPLGKKDVQRCLENAVLMLNEKAKGNQEALEKLKQELQATLTPYEPFWPFTKDHSSSVYWLYSLLGEAFTQAGESELGTSMYELAGIVFPLYI